MASVLLVEDEALTAMDLGSDLAVRGHEVRDASDGAMAIAMLKDFSPDILVTDMTMPRVDGAGLIRHVRLTQRHMPIVLVTALPEAHLPQGLMYDAYLSKPVDHDRLGAIVARLTGELH